jgi:hypothetical protein
MGPPESEAAAIERIDQRLGVMRSRFASWRNTMLGNLAAYR